MVVPGSARVKLQAEQEDFKMMEHSDIYKMPSS